MTIKTSKHFFSFIEKKLMVVLVWWTVITINWINLVIHSDIYRNVFKILRLYMKLLLKSQTLRNTKTKQPPPLRFLSLLNGSWKPGMLIMLLGIVWSSFDSVNITTFACKNPMLAISSLSRPSVRIELMVQWAAMKQFASSGEPLHKSRLIDWGCSSGSEKQKLVSRSLWSSSKSKEKFTVSFRMSFEKFTVSFRVAFEK